MITTNTLYRKDKEQVTAINHGYPDTSNAVQQLKWYQFRKKTMLFLKVIFCSSCYLFTRMHIADTTYVRGYIKKESFINIDKS